MMSPAPLPHLGLVLTGIAPGAGTPAPLPHLGLLEGLGSLGLRLTAEAGSYALSGQDAGSRRGIVLPAEQGYIALYGQVGLLSKSTNSSGEAAPLPHLASLFIPTFSARTLTCDPGNYSIVGSEGLLDHEHDADTTTYSVTGQAANLLIGLALPAESGTYQISGQAADSTRSGPAQTMSAESGTYSVVGQEAETLAAHTVAAEQGFYPILGQQVVLSVGTSGNTILTAEFGEYLLTGQDSSFTLVAAPSTPDTVTGAGDMSFLHMEEPKRKSKKKLPEEKPLRKELERAYDEAVAAPPPPDPPAPNPYIDSIKALSAQLEFLQDRFQAMEDKQKRIEASRRKRMQQLLID